MRRRLVGGVAVLAAIFAGDGGARAAGPPSAAELPVALASSAGAGLLPAASPSSPSAAAAGVSASSPATPSSPAPRGTTVTFPYEQERLLQPTHGPGGLVYLPKGAAGDAPLPVVVFLHGMNAYGHLHMGFGAPFTDLRTVVDGLVEGKRTAPFVLAAPSHTKGAWAARRMWPELDVAHFLAASEAALGGAARIDRSRVIVVAHSGGACNPDGGLFAPSVRKLSPLAVLAVDTCLYDDVIPRLASLAEEVPLQFFWQRTWDRPVETLTDTCPRCAIWEMGDLAPKPSPHLTILPPALEQALPDLLTPEARGG